MIIAITIVEHGYEIDYLDHQAYLNGKIIEMGFTCRDYGVNVNSEKVEKALKLLVMNADKINLDKFIEENSSDL